MNIRFDRYLCVSLCEPCVADGHPLHCGPVVDLHEPLVRVLVADGAVLVCHAQSDVEVLLVGDAELAVAAVAVLQLKGKSFRAKAFALKENYIRDI